MGRKQVTQLGMVDRTDVFNLDGSSMETPGTIFILLGISLRHPIWVAQPDLWVDHDASTRLGVIWKNLRAHPAQS